jgi:hypothetical protein
MHKCMDGSQALTGGAVQIITLRTHGSMNSAATFRACTRRQCVVEDGLHDSMSDGSVNDGGFMDYVGDSSMIHGG